MSTKKHKGKGPQAMTANDLRSGNVVYLNPHYVWTDDFNNVLLSEDTSEITKMQDVASDDSRNNLVIDAYFIDVDPDTKKPLRYRERFRAQGPSYDPRQPAKGE